MRALPNHVHFVHICYRYFPGQPQVGFAPQQGYGPAPPQQQGYGSFNVAFEGKGKIQVLFNHALMLCQCLSLLGETL